MGRSRVNDTYSVYCHTSPNGKRYVGISCNPQKRWGKNGQNYAKNYRFSRAIKKYGWKNITHTILFAGLKIEQAKEIEIGLISKWHLTDFKYGYNIREGGDGAFSLESRKKMGKSRLGNHNYADHHTEETKKKVSEGLKRYYAEHPKKKKRLVYKIYKEEDAPKRKRHADVRGEKNPSAKKVRQLSLDGEFIREYPYAKMATEENGYDLSAIIKCCRGKLKTSYGYKWEYA